MSRPKGACNVKPSKRAIDTYYRLLADKAEEGDTTAAGWLCQLDLLDRERHERAAATTAE